MDQLTAKSRSEIGREIGPHYTNKTCKINEYNFYFS
jgi:hypothetical protein